MEIKGEVTTAVCYAKVVDEKAIEQIVPLAQTMKKKIDGLREWASTRARLASAEKNNEKFEVVESDSENLIIQTKREKEEDIF